MVESTKGVKLKRSKTLRTSGTNDKPPQGAKTKSSTKPKVTATAASKQKSKPMALAAHAASTPMVSSPSGPDWQSFFTYTNMGMTDAWIEHMQIAVLGGGSYALRIWNPPVRRSDEREFIEWRSPPKVQASDLLRNMIAGLSAQGMREELGFAAALALMPTLPAVDATTLNNTLKTELAARPSLLVWLKFARRDIADKLEALASR